MKDLNNALAKAAVTDNPEDWCFFRYLRNLVTNKSRIDKKKYEENKLQHLKKIVQRFGRQWLGEFRNTNTTVLVRKYGKKYSFSGLLDEQFFFNNI